MFINLEMLCLEKLPFRFGNYCRMRVDMHFDFSRSDTEGRSDKS